MKNNKGFTLIELLVVVLIIGILAAIALPQYTKTVEKSRASEAMLILKAATDAANRFYLMEGSYTGIILTGATSNLDIEIPASSSNFFFNLGTCASTSCGIVACRKASSAATDCSDAKYNITFTTTDGGKNLARVCSGDKNGECVPIQKMLD